MAIFITVIMTMTMMMMTVTMIAIWIPQVKWKSCGLEQCLVDGRDNWPAWGNQALLGE